MNNKHKAVLGILGFGGAAATILALSRRVNGQVSISVDEVDNGLEKWVNTELVPAPNPHLVALYVLTKSFINKPVPRQAEVISYLNSKQDVEGAWSAVWTKMFTTHRVLYAYLVMGAKPTKSLDAFFMHYYTQAGMESYIQNETKSDARDVYHIIVGYRIWGGVLPLWMDALFTYIEGSFLTSTHWTSSDNLHRTSHILYSYQLARRRTLAAEKDNILNAVFRNQQVDGSWIFFSNNKLYSTYVALRLLREIEADYGSNNSIVTAIEKAKVYIASTYKRLSNGLLVLGYFQAEPPFDVGYSKAENNFWGIYAAISAGILIGNEDPTFEKIVTSPGMR